LANHSPVTHRARFQSLYDITHALGRAIGPKVLGTYLLVHTFSDAWSMITFIGLGTCIWFLTLGLIETRQLKKANK
ncbi:MAG: hypothetical protein IJC68_00510, partial [Firmicutes bacterium]|nr:hypothetical protein [Bacillota bacterium]